MVSMMPMARPDTAMANANRSSLWHSGMTAKTTEMRSVDTAKADKELTSLRQIKKTLCFKLKAKVLGLGGMKNTQTHFCRVKTFLKWKN